MRLQHNSLPLLPPASHLNTLVSVKYPRYHIYYLILFLNGQWLNIYSAYQKCIKIFKLQTINESETLKTETVLTALQRSLVLQANVVSSHDQCVFILLLHHYAVLCL